MVNCTPCFWSNLADGWLLDINVSNVVKNKPATFWRFTPFTPPIYGTVWGSWSTTMSAPKLCLLVYNQMDTIVVSVINHCEIHKKNKWTLRKNHHPLCTMWCSRFLWAETWLMHIHRKYLGETCDKGPETGFDEQKIFHAKRHKRVWKWGLSLRKHLFLNSTYHTYCKYCYLTIVLGVISYISTYGSYHPWLLHVMIILIKKPNCTPIADDFHCNPTWKSQANGDDPTLNGPGTGVAYVCLRWGARSRCLSWWTLALANMGWWGMNTYIIYKQLLYVSVMRIINQLNKCEALHLVSINCYFDR